MDDISVEDVTNWWEQYIEKVREGGGTSLGGVQDFSSPCQVEVFWIGEPLEGQAIVVTHDRDRPDGEVIVNGPFGGDEFIDEVAAVSDEPRWQQPVPPQNYRTPPGKTPQRSDVLASIISALVEKLQQSIFTDFPTRDRLFVSSRRRWGNSSSHICVGNVVNATSSDEGDEENVTDSGEGELETADGDDGSESSSNDGGQTSEPMGGGFIYPAVWVDEAPERSFGEKVWGSHFPDSEIAFRGKVLGDEFVAFRDGLLAILDDDGDRTLDVLNTFFGLGIFGQYFMWRSLQPREFISGRVGEDRLKGTHAELSTPSGRNELLHGDSQPADYERSLIESEVIEWLLRVTEVVYQDSDLRERLHLHLQAHTHFLDDEYTASFLLNWIVVEQHIQDILGANLRDEYGVNRDRRDTITNGLNWSISHCIELAEITDNIDEGMYDELERHRSKRNNVVHKMETVDLEQAEDMDHLVSELLCRAVNAELELTDIDPVVHRPVPMKPKTRRGEYHPVKWGE